MINIFDLYRLSDNKKTNGPIDLKFIVDYGIVKEVHADKTIDVTHVSQSVLIDGTILDAFVSYNLEVLWPASSGLAIVGTVDVGDGVLLVGLRNVVQTVKAIQHPTVPSDFHHYTQETMKAIPLGIFTDTPSILIEESGGKVGISYTAGNLLKMPGQLAGYTADAFTQITGALSALAALVPGGAAAIASFLTPLVTAIANVTTVEKNINGGTL